jgi:hypothetical protein
MKTFISKNKNSILYFARCAALLFYMFVGIASAMVFDVIWKGSAVMTLLSMCLIAMVIVFSIKNTGDGAIIP